MSRRRGDLLTFRYLHFYRLHTSLYPNTSSIQLNSYAYKLLSPLSRPSGASSPQGEPLLTLTSIHLVSTRRASPLPKVNSSCLHTENLSYTDPNAISKSNSDLPHKERSLQIIAKIQTPTASISIQSVTRTANNTHIAHIKRCLQHRQILAD